LLNYQQKSSGLTFYWTTL